MNELIQKRRLSDVVAEFEFKLAAIPQALVSFNNAGTELMTAVTIAGTYGQTRIDTGRVYERELISNLTKSAWQYVYNTLQISYISSPKDKKRFEQMMASPPPFNMDNLREIFGDYLLDPRGNILRGLAEVFCDLDQSYKSHDKVKIGVKGLPKRVIIQNVGSYGSYGRNQLIAMLNALAAYQNKPLVECEEIKELDNSFSYTRGHGSGDFKIDGKQVKLPEGDERIVPDRGVTVRKYQNGNAHIIFEQATLLDINRALAEYYGDVLPDVSEEKPTERKESTAVAKDLQYYPTPVAVVNRVIDNILLRKGERVLEPSCGCGRFMDALRDAGAEVVGCEVDPTRAAICEAKGHRVLRANFLDTLPTPIYDHVVMNPPFYGKHYAKHIQHALKFLKPGGILTSILPSTARYDHGLVDGDWRDLPVGSFSESGTNINTTVLTIRKPREAQGMAA